MALPLMQKATAVWLVENTTLTFRQIANRQLTAEEIRKAEKDPAYRLKLYHNPAAEGEEKRKGPRYTPLSKRQDRPAAIAWLVKFHPELSDGQISKLVGTTKPTIESIRDRSHWNIASISPVDPVALGLCKQGELDAAVAKAVRKSSDVMSDAERMKLVSTEQSLAMETRLPSSISGLENFTLGGGKEGGASSPREAKVDAESLFNLPASAGDDDED
jgi:hypothetical protein